jgi:hypothetical protein
LDRTRWKCNYCRRGLCIRVNNLHVILWCELQCFVACLITPWTPYIDMGVWKNFMALAHDSDHRELYTPNPQNGRNILISKAVLGPQPEAFGRGKWLQSSNNHRIRRTKTRGKLYQSTAFNWLPEFVNFQTGHIRVWKSLRFITWPTIILRTNRSSTISQKSLFLERRSFFSHCRFGIENAEISGAFVLNFDQRTQNSASFDEIEWRFNLPQRATQFQFRENRRSHVTNESTTTASCYHILNLLAAIFSDNLRASKGSRKDGLGLIADQ